jgi:hypothetical protein
MACTKSLQACKEACALNNSAVAMMQRGEFEASLKTLKDSIAHMEMVSHPISWDIRGDGAQKRIRMASARLSKTYTAAASTATWSSLGVVESNDFCALHSVATNPQTRTNFSPFVPVLIREPS